MPETLPQIIAAFDSEMKLEDVLRKDITHVDADGRINVVQQGMLGLARVALREYGSTIMSGIQWALTSEEHKELLKGVETDAEALPQPFLQLLERHRFAYHLCLDNIGGNQNALLVLNGFGMAAKQKKNEASTYGGLKLHSTSALLGLENAPLYALADTEMLFHAPRVDNDTQKKWEERAKNEIVYRQILEDMRKLQQRNTVNIHEAIHSRVLGMIRRYKVGKKLRRVREDANNMLGEVTFKASELPGVVEKTFPAPPALAEEFTKRSGVKIRTDRDTPMDGFFTMMAVRDRAIRRAKAELGDPVDFIMQAGGRYGTRLGGRTHLLDRANEIFNEETHAVQAQGELRE